MCPHDLAIKDKRTSDILFISLVRRHRPCKVCQGRKNVSGPLRPLCPCAGAEEWVLRERWRSRTWKQREGRRKNATAGRSQRRQCRGTGCCLCGDLAALSSSPGTAKPDVQMCPLILTESEHRGGV